MIVPERGIRAAICFCISLLAFWALPSGAQTASAQRSGSLGGGGTYTIAPDANAPSAAIDLWFRAPSSGYNLRYPGIAKLAVAALAASSPPHGTSLADLVTRYGGTLTLSVYPDITMAGVSVPAADAPRFVQALSAAYFATRITPEGLKAALRDAAVSAAEARFDPQRVLQNALFAKLFVSGPAHVPAAPQSAAEYSAISAAAVDIFAARAFREGNAVLSLAGNVNAALLADVRAAKDAGATMDAPFDSAVAAQPGEAAQSAATPGLGFAWAGPPITDARAATAMDFVADYLFDSQNGAVASAANRLGGDSYVAGQFITLHGAGVLLATVSGAQALALEAPIASAISAMKDPLNPGAFESARAAFEYHIRSELQTPSQRADNFGWYAVEGNAAYAPGDESGRYFGEIATLDPEFVAQTVRKYLVHPAIVRLTVEGAQGTSS